MKLLKSKILLGVMIFAVMFVGFAVVKAASAAECDLGTVTLKQGMSGTAVTCLQTKLGVTPITGYFGTITKGKVVAFQTANSLKADGIVGALTKAALGLTTTTTTTTGTTLPAGCTAGALFSSTTGAPCVTTTPSTLSGGAGSADLSSTSTDVEDSVKEGDSEKVLGFKVEADGSDIAVTNVKLEISNKDFAASSEKLTNYIDEVAIYKGSTKVGSVDASDFSRDSGSPDVYSKSIAISNAVVKEGDKDAFYVEFTAVSNIDSDDMTADLVVDLTQIRYQDATGVIFSDDFDAYNYDTATAGEYENIVSFSDISTDDQITIKSSTANPAASSVEVDAEETTDNVLVGAFKFDVDEDSSDIQINEIPVVLTIDDSADTGTSDDADAIIDSVMVKIDGTEYDADLDSETITNGDGTATYLVTLDDEELVIDAGDVAEAKIYVSFNDQDGNYGSNTTVYAKVTGASVDAEGEDDEVAVDGSFTGKTHTLVVDQPLATIVSKSFVSYLQSDTNPDTYVATFKFNVAASEDEDAYVSNEAADYTYTAVDGLGNDISGYVTSVDISATNDIEEDYSFLIPAGETEELIVKVYIAGSDVTGKITLTGVAYGTDDTSADNDSGMITTLTNFNTSTYLAI